MTARVRGAAGARAVATALGLAWRASRALTIAFAVLSTLMAVLPVTIAWCTKLVLDEIADGRAGAGVTAALGAALAGCGVLTALGPQIVQYVRDESGRRIGLVAQDSLFRATERFVGLARFEDPAFLDRIRMAQQYGGATPGMVVSAALGTARTAMTGAGFLVSLVTISPWMAVLVVGAAAPSLAAELWLSRRRAAMLWGIGPVERREFFFGQLLVNVQAAKELRLFGIGAHLRGLMNAQRRAANAERSRTDRRELGVQAVTGTTAALAAGGGLLWVLVSAANGTGGVGDVALFVAAVAGVQAAAGGLVLELVTVHQQVLLFGHYLAVLDAEPDLPVPARPRRAGPLRRGIELKDVWFRYSPGHPWTLRGVSLTIPYGTAVALAGRNGAGKSTLVKLLCRMYDPERGSVRWDGIDLRELDPAELRARIGAVFQDYMEYDLTAADNIGLGDLAAMDDRGRIEAAARRAGVHGVVSGLPRGYDTMLSRVFADPAQDGGDVGVHLSGGQWQRLALARAYLRGERDLLILDEPSSGLDAEAEHEIHQGLREHRRGRTSLLISHRLGAVRDADHIVVLDGGQVAEQGTHAGLLARGGIYAHLFALQAEGYRQREDRDAGAPRDRLSGAR
ncbi:MULTISPECIES: ABC transporter ATP-binding protein [Microbispora]|uniref:Multidrug ABC transporter permease n=1 Tax=Microbispora siamensis TaxID=564413 RepID=A0ABQ4GPG7_9ACTN|nr:MULTISPECIES: ABC transporter ATP-binding protein [Microbispora]OPG10658.1 multidrug ABC transporter permease [Microbispora sp. GKU 823]GIH63322.1 multidrug ABC transporter permease [Microbispora siamensis]